MAEAGQNNIANYMSYNVQEDTTPINQKCFSHRKINPPRREIEPRSPA